MLSILSVTMALLRSEVMLVMFPVFVVFLMEQRIRMWLAFRVCLFRALIVSLDWISIP